MSDEVVALGCVVQPTPGPASARMTFLPGLSRSISRILPRSAAQGCGVVVIGAEFLVAGSGAGDGNRTRTISLGSSAVRACHMD